MHELLRAYAEERARDRDSQAERRSAVHRVLDYYLHAAISASNVIAPYFSHVARSRPRPGVVLEEISGREQATVWFENERSALLAAIGQAVEGGYVPHAWELPWAAGSLFQDEASWRRLATAQESALALAVRRGDRHGLVMARQHLGWLSFLLGDIVKASHHLDEAVELAEQFGDERLRALASLNRAYVLQSQGRIHDAVVQARRALWLYRAAADQRGEMRALYAIGWGLVELGDSRRAARFSSWAFMAYRGPHEPIT